MRTAVGINLLASVWIWLYQQSDHVISRIDRKLGGTIEIVSENEEGGGRSIRNNINDIVAAAKSKIRLRAVIGVSTAAGASALVLFISFFVKDDVPLCGSAWWGTLALTFLGPAAMGIAFVSIQRASSQAVTQSNNTINDIANALRDQQPRAPTPPTSPSDLP